MWYMRAVVIRNELRERERGREQLLNIYKLSQLTSTNYISSRFTVTRKPHYSYREVLHQY